MKEFEIKNNKYHLGDKYLKFPVHAKYGIFCNNHFIVSLDWREIEKKLPGEDPRRAIWCYDSQGNIKWKVEAPYYLDPLSNKRFELPDHIDSFSYWKDDNIIVVFGRMGYRLDPETGKLLEIVYKER